MNKKIKALLILLGIGIIAGVLIFQFVYNKSHPDYANETALYSLDAKDVFEKYKNNTAEANEKYTGAMIQVNGSLDKVEQSDTTAVAVFVFSEGMFGDEGVRCVMLPKHVSKVRQLSLPRQVEIKGMCVGYNDTDVIMEHCVLN
jgi:hypothetical protein